MKIAVEGCAHGELDVIYERIAQEEARGHFKVDLLICCGDFQSVRNASDLACMAVPQKYKEMCSFHKYYSGEKRAPILTVFIGGNHEASNYLQELPYGGWVAPGIYYMGYAGVVQFRGLRIAGLSGIYKGPDYLKGRHELPPYNNSTIRSVYHVRNLDVFRLRQLTGKIDILITHDWPRGIYNYGDKNTLLRYKEFFREEVEQNTLGSRAGELLLEDVRPAHWFAAHLHVRFTATVNHEEKDGKPASVTRFLALDKCLPKRKFLEIIDFPDGNSNKNYLDYDEEWLAILKSTNHLLSVVNSTQHMPGPGYSGRWDFRPTKEELAKVKSAFNPDLRIPENFIRTAPVFNGRHRFDGVVPDPLKNPQTESFCDKLGVDDPVEVILSSRAPAKKRVDVSVVEESELDVTLSGTNEKTDISISTDSEDTGSPGLFFVDKQGSTPSSTLNSTPRLPSFSRSTPNFNRSGNAFSPSSPFQSPPLTQRFRMTLPSPKQDKQEEAMVSRGTLGPKIYPSSPLAIRYPAESPKRECNSDVGPRQFKRRNASLYDASE